MSAETEIKFFRMSNGQIWAAVIQGGMTDEESFGFCLGIAFRGDYREAKAWFARQCKMDMFDPDYVWTEYGGRLPSLQQLEQRPVSFVRSELLVSTKQEGSYPTPTCRDLKRRVWRVVEFDRDGSCSDRVLGESLYFAEAWNLAHTYAMQQPGTCKLQFPERFYRPVPKKKRVQRTVDSNEHCVAMPARLPESLDWV